MGLYDTIFIDKSVSLPIPKEYRGPDLYSFDYQTKNLDNWLDFFILKDGKLMKNETLEIVNTNVVINFYNLINDYDENNDAWIEFQALIMNGKLENPIKIFEFKLTNNQKRKDGLKKLSEEIQKEKDLSFSKKRFIIYPIRYCKKNLRKLIYKLGNSIINISYKIR